MSKGASFSELESTHCFYYFSLKSILSLALVNFPPSPRPSLLRSFDQAQDGEPVEPPPGVKERRDLTILCGMPNGDFEVSLIPFIPFIPEISAFAAPAETSFPALAPALSPSRSVEMFSSAFCVQRFIISSCQPSTGSGSSIFH